MSGRPISSTARARFEGRASGLDETAGELNGDMVSSPSSSAFRFRFAMLNCGETVARLEIAKQNLQAADKSLVANTRQHCKCP